MRLTVFGPTGPTGEQIGRRALAADYEVIALARRPDTVDPADPRLRVPATYRTRHPCAVGSAGTTPSRGSTSKSPTWSREGDRA